jgi:hypothetical protein
MSITALSLCASFVNALHQITFIKGDGCIVHAALSIKTITLSQNAVTLTVEGRNTNRENLYIILILFKLRRETTANNI